MGRSTTAFLPWNRAQLARNCARGLEHVADELALGLVALAQALDRPGDADRPGDDALTVLDRSGDRRDSLEELAHLARPSAPSDRIQLSLEAIEVDDGRRRVTRQRPRP